jgi:tetratricopeptide (TPR) repeat protein
MPTHIFVALGMWEDVVRENIRSAQAADERRARKNLGLDARGYHAIWWLEYGYLQLGKVSKAREILNQMHKEALESGSPRTRMHFSVMKAAYLVETDNWSDDVLKMKVDLAGMNNSIKVLNGFLEGYGAIKNNNMEKAKSILVDLKQMNTGIATFAEYNLDEKESAVMVSLLEGSYLYESGKTSEGINLLNKARESEESLSYSFGPPAIPKPSHEILGEIYLKEGNFNLAESNFRTSLQRAPRRVMSLKGLYKALKELTMMEQAEEILADIKKIRENADRDLYPEK